MLILSLILTLTFIVTTFIMILSSTLSKKTIMDREKMSPFECGFDPKASARLPFSLRFFLIAVIFLIFDVEITLLLPLAPTLTHTNALSWSFSGFFFLLILLLGLFFEWGKGALEWSH
uniref:NADH-ubiquinone oxidoreductase chain 3 n=1 Tax=Parastacus brasiliensis TaxID=108041 RepID=A0A411ATQ0_9EUCA|nr:NADH dehydrogenase subunit 3 [Parastacus brasiliensis]